MKTKSWVGVSAAVGLVLIPVVSRYSAGEAAKTVDVEQATLRTIRASVLASGNLVYQDQAQLSPEVIGKVTRVLVREGDKVTRGQVVLTIEDQQLRAEVAQREAAVRMQRLKIEQQRLSAENQDRQFKRLTKLSDKGFATAVRLEDARYSLDVALVDLKTSLESLRQAEAILQQAREQLAKTVVRAPIGGTVVAVNIKAGETAVPSATGIAGSSFMTIADSNSMMAEINIDEADIASVRVGQAVAITSAAYQDKMINGVVESIAVSPRRPEAGMLGAGGATAARAYSVKVRLKEAGQLSLRPGMSCRAEIFTASSSRVLAVPLQAVLSNNQEDIGERTAKTPIKAESHVFVVRDRRVYKQMVQIGLSDDSYQQVIAGLAKGEIVATGPYKDLRFLYDGQLVVAKGLQR